MDSELILREQICEVGRRMYIKNMVASNDGNISVKLNDDTFICTPTGVSKGYMTSDMLCVVNSKCEQIEKNINNLYKPSSEMKMHLAIYNERPDIMAVVHAHPINATAFAVCNKPLDMQIMSEATMSLGIVPVAKYGAPSTKNLSLSVIPFLQNHDAILLANHGAVTFATDLFTAFAKMESVEFYATVIYKSLIIGGAKEFTNEEIKELIDIRDNYYKMSGKHPRQACFKS